ncbi:hypothetical protein BV898_01300 [Hypsibius exemplaris]|uniref:TSC22 domain family protein 1 n=1 Tax=Hypsibius exemplaris TaxID=2072580 RepID=A0A1W0XBD4_HYPEX|nr:hypothetical protein BV898_01300 [Hypsibius exemplaris]
MASHTLISHVGDESSSSSDAAAVKKCSPLKGPLSDNANESHPSESDILISPNPGASSSHFTGSTETLCPERTEGMADDSSCNLTLPLVSPLLAKPEILATATTVSSPSAVTASTINNTIVGKVTDSLHKPGNNITASRSRQQNVGFSDNRSETSSIPSKFKVVKLESKAPYFRGRWQCFDYHDRATKEPASKDKLSSDQSSTSTTTTTTTAGVAINQSTITSSVAADLVPSEPVTVVAVGALAANGAKPATKFKVTAVQLPPNTPAINGHPTPLVDSNLAGKSVTDNFRVLPVIPSGVSPNLAKRLSQDSSDSSTLSSVSQQSAAQPRMQAQTPIPISDANAALSAELSRRIDVTAAGSQETAGLSLDNKIRQCMDLVGNHLIIAVREELGMVLGEVAKLKEKLEQLEFENGALRSENIALRAAAGAEAQTRSQQPSRRKLDRDRSVSLHHEYSVGADIKFAERLYSTNLLVYCTYKNPNVFVVFHCKCREILYDFRYPNQIKIISVNR